MKTLPTTLNLIIPSKPQINQVAFLKKSIQSVKSQVALHKFKLQIWVAVDKVSDELEGLLDSLGASPVLSKGSSQAEALNTAISGIDCDEPGIIAFLEDDDEWMPDYLCTASLALRTCGFVSSTQIEVDEAGEHIRINDFPTPSGWMMLNSTLKRVKKFSLDYRFHLDNEWLGRLAEAGIERMHLVESTAPIELRHVAEVRPWLANVLKNSMGLCRLARHTSPLPLVRRLVHPDSGMARISRDPALRQVSDREVARLVRSFGRVPW